MEDATAERWIAVPGVKGFYEVSTHGRVQSLPRRKCRGQILKGRAMPNGYLQVSLSIHNVVRLAYIHRLVAAAFLGPCPEGMEVRHLDGNPANNRLDNLAYGTHAENMQDMIRHGRATEGTRHYGSKLTDPQVAEMRATWAQGVRVTDLALRYGVSKATVSRIVNGNAYRQGEVPVRLHETCRHPDCGSPVRPGRDGKGLAFAFCNNPGHNARSAAKARAKRKTLA